jgi:hypothetical protein
VVRRRPGVRAEQHDASGRRGGFSEATAGFPNQPLIDHGLTVQPARDALELPSYLRACRTTALAAPGRPGGWAPRSAREASERSTGNSASPAPVAGARSAAPGRRLANCRRSHWYGPASTDWRELGEPLVALGQHREGVLLGADHHKRPWAPLVRSRLLLNRTRRCMCEESVVRLIRAANCDVRAFSLWGTLVESPEGRMMACGGQEPRSAADRKGCRGFTWIWARDVPLWPKVDATALRCREAGHGRQPVVLARPRRSPGRSRSRSPCP